MKIGLWNLEPKIVNSAMMRASSYFKKRGHEVEIYQAYAFPTYDKIYVFSIFDFTPKKNIPPGAICGGSGFDISSQLPNEIQEEEYDWSLYPDCDFSIVWFSMGCIHNCPFCIVRQKEGAIHPVQHKNLNPNGKYIKVMDNNFFANPEWKKAIAQLEEWGQPLDFQGVDIRIITEEQCQALNRLKHHKQIKIAWDNPKDDLIPQLEMIKTHIKPYKLMSYVLIGYWSTMAEDIHRVETLRQLKIDPFVMAFSINMNINNLCPKCNNPMIKLGDISWCPECCDSGQGESKEAGGPLPES